jgi:hypothetical protein
VAGDLAVLLPTLWEYLSLASWDDGSARVTSSLLLFVEDGLCKLCLNDRALERTGWASGVTLEAALSAMDASLADGRMEWRKARAFTGGKRR